jgi:hypothetical protein
MQANSSPWHADVFASALATLRTHLSVKQATLAQWAGVGAPQVSRWNGGTSRPGYDPLRQMLTTAIEHAPPGDDGVAWEMAHRVADAAGYPNMPLEGEGAGGGDGVVSPYSGEVWRIVRSLQRRAEDAGLTPEQEREAIEAVLRRADDALERDLDAELYRLGRDTTSE